MITREEITCIGRFVKAHGVKGELLAHVQLPAAVLEDCRCVVTDIEGIFVPFFITSLRIRSQESALLSIDNISHESDASLLVGREIYILNSDYARWSQSVDDDVPLGALTGFAAEINAGATRGTLVHVDDTTANVLLYIELSDGRTIMVPAVEEFVTDIDVEQRRIRVQVPDELFDL